MEVKLSSFRSPFDVRLDRYGSEENLEGGERYKGQILNFAAPNQPLPSTFH
jgi:hypothetical protein